MTTEHLNQFNALLLQGIKLLHSLDTLMDQELDAVARRDTALLETTCMQKRTVLEEFQHNTFERAKILGFMQLENKESGVQKLISQASEAAATQLTDNWEQLKKELHSASEKNRRNEQAVLRNKHNVDKLLSIIRGQKTQDSIYNTQGSAGHYRAQSRIGKA
ncbi:flagella synthesis protein FlgN [Marinobacterium jannaschii]|uniref:flagella synthesis protein FlgN n=1 Tax=Marinobacterium jannaschii TaxID=64970 RepID=UPI0004861C1E|nr:flagellar protein FlgN [Marinobacterium jannaschii]